MSEPSTCPECHKPYDERDLCVHADGCQLGIWEAEDQDFNILRDSPVVRAHMTGIETRPAWKPAWKLAAEAGGTLRGDGSDGAYTFGPLPTERTINICTPHVATLPDGSRVELPAGTVLREAPTSEPTPQENFAALKLMAPSLAGVYERAGVKLGIEPHLVTEEQAYEECPALRLADPLPIKPRT